MSAHFQARLRCIANCDGEYSLFEPRYRCPKCGALLEVAHDLGALKAAHDGKGWRALFDARSTLSSREFPSPLWGKHEWIAPELRIDQLVSLGEGGTPLVAATRAASAFGTGELWIKQSGTSHTGSFKDLGMTVLVSAVRQMITDGRPVRAIACASTGDTSAALAAYAAAAGIRAVVLLPRGKITVAQLVQPIAHGALVLSLDTDFDGCMAIVKRLAEEADVYLANSMNSLRLEGQKTVAIEIAQQLGWQVPDVVVIPGGNLGNVSALGAGFEMLEALGVIASRPRIVVAQAERANPLYRAYKDGWRFQPIKAQPTLASAIQIGDPVSIDKAIRALKRFDGIVEQATEQELVDAQADADRAGLYVCPHTSVALAALRKLVQRGEIPARARAVVVSTASGIKFTDVKVRYHEEKLDDLRATHANHPIEVRADFDEVRRAIDSRV
jgi:threonine synthase